MSAAKVAARIFEKPIAAGEEIFVAGVILQIGPTFDSGDPDVKCCSPRHRAFPCGCSDRLVYLGIWAPCLLKRFRQFAGYFRTSSKETRHGQILWKVWGTY